MINISEKSFEQTIEDILIASLPAKEWAISETTPLTPPISSQVSAGHPRRTHNSRSHPQTYIQPAARTANKHTKHPRPPVTGSGPWRRLNHKLGQ